MANTKKEENIVKESKELIVLNSSKEIMDFLKEKNFDFRIWSISIYKESNPDPKEDTRKELSYIKINEETYQDLKKLSEIINISIEELINEELEAYFKDYIGDQPVYTLSKYIDFEDQKKVHEFIKQMKESFNLELNEDYLESFRMEMNKYKESL